MNYIVFDIETRNFFDDVGSNDPADLDIAVLCAYDSASDSYSHYFVEDLNKLWPLIERTDALVTFNGNHFDIPLLAKYYSGDLSKFKSIDLLVSVRNSLGRRLKLNTLAKATLGKAKIADGIEAVNWWKEKNFEKLIEYCTEDVRITKEVFDYARKNGVLKYEDGGVIKDIKIDTSTWDSKNDSAVTFTLPF